MCHPHLFVRIASSMIECIAAVMYNSVVLTQYIVSNPNILDGEPVIAGTRIPVVELLLLLKEGHTLGDVQRMYPHVALPTFERVLEEVAATIAMQPQSYAL